MPNKKSGYNEDLTIGKIPMEMGTLIQQARQAKGMTQRELAVKINEKQQIVKDYEAGRGVIQAAIMAKIERVLGVKLRGKNTGKANVKPLGENK